MQLHRIEIKNFLSVGDATYSYEKQGLVLVEGNNRDVESSNSNGAGKSNTIVDALTWCLFGQTTRGLAADQVLPSGGTGCRVAVFLEVDGREIEVHRHRKHKEGKNGTKVFVEGKDVSKSTNPATDKLLQELLKISKKSFLYTTILGQGLMFRFSQLTDQERKEVLETIVDLDVFEAARKQARKRAREYKSHLDTLSGSYREINVNLVDYQEHLRKLKTQQEQELEKKEAERNEILAEIETTETLLKGEEEKQSGREGVEKALEKSRVVLQKAAAELDEIRDRRTVAQVSQTQASGQIEKMTKLKGGASCPTCNTLLDGHALAEEAKRLMGVQSECTVRLKEVMGEHSSKSRVLDTAQSAVSDLEAQVWEFSSRETQIAGHQQHVESLRRKLVKVDEQDPLGPQVQIAQDLLDKVTKRKKEITKEMAGTQATLDLHEFWVEGFQDIRTHVISQMLGFLNNRLAHYCEVMTDGEIGVRLILTEKGKIDLQVTTRGGSYASASGGEKDRIDIAVAFALHDLATQQTEFRSNVLVLDEVAVFVDEAGIERLMQLVSEKLDRIETCFLVSQNPVFKGYADTVWTVVKEGGVSRLEVA